MLLYFNEGETKTLVASFHHLVTFYMMINILMADIYPSSCFSTVWAVSRFNGETEFPSSVH